MAIEFKYKGTTWRADTPEEAVALRNELEKSDKVWDSTFDAMDRSDQLWTPDRFMDVVYGIGELQRRLLVAVKRKPGITSKELVGELGMDSEVALAGVISGLSKKLTEIGINLKQVLQIDVKWRGKKKIRTFLLDDFFLYAAEEQNWPDAWQKKLKAKAEKRYGVEDSRATNVAGTKTRKASD